MAQFMGRGILSDATPKYSPGRFRSGPSARPSAMLYTLGVPFLAMAAVMAWRILPTGLAAAFSIAAIGASILATLMSPIRGRRLLTPLAMIAALTALAPAIGLWPCDIACAGGGAWLHFWGLDIHILGGIAAGLLAALAWPTSGPGRPLAVAVCGWGLVGASGYFLCVAASLGLVCPQCLAYHTVILALVPPLLRSTPFPSLALALPAALLLHLGYVLQGVECGRPPIPSRSTTHPGRADPAFMQAMEDGRCQGSPAAPLVLDLVLDFQCPACAEDYTPLTEALGGALAAGRLRLVVRPLVRPAEPAGRELAAWAMAAASGGRRRFQMFLAEMLGSPTEATITDLHRRLGQLLDSAALDAVLGRHRATIMGAVDADQRRLLASHATGVTPIAILRDAPSGRELERWQGSLPAAAIAAKVAAGR